MTIKEKTIQKFKKQITEVKSKLKKEKEVLKDKEVVLQDLIVENEINAKVVECDLNNYETQKAHLKNAYDMFVVRLFF